MTEHFCDLVSNTETIADVIVFCQQARSLKTSSASLTIQAESRSSACAPHVTGDLQLAIGV